jgi:hypothetical protein
VPEPGLEVASARAPVEAGELGVGAGRSGHR